MTTQQAEDRPLLGIRIVDFTTFMAGPYCTRYLADMGAEVIKVEASGGDFIRTQKPMRDGASTYFGHLNAGKKSVVLDLKNPQDVDAVRRLIATADVVVENFRPGVMKRMGLDHQTLRRDQPALIYCSISGFGQQGEGAERPAFAQIIQATSGYDLANLSYQVGRDIDRPINPLFFFADVLSAVYGLGAIASALYQRTRTGEGQHIDLSLMECMMNMMPYEVQEAQFPTGAMRPIYRPLRTSDGFVILVPNTQRNFENLCASIGRPDLANDPDFATPQARGSHLDRLFDEVEKWTAERTSKACEEKLVAASVPCARYRTVSEAMQDPQLALRQAFQKVVDKGGAFLVPNLPFRMTGSSVTVRPHVPELGECDIEDLIAGS